MLFSIRGDFCSYCQLSLYVSKLCGRIDSSKNVPMSTSGGFKSKFYQQGSISVQLGKNNTETKLSLFWRITWLILEVFSEIFHLQHKRAAGSLNLIVDISNTN